MLRQPKCLMSRNFFWSKLLRHPKCLMSRNFVQCLMRFPSFLYIRLVIRIRIQFPNCLGNFIVPIIQLNRQIGVQSFHELRYDGPGPGPFTRADFLDTYGGVDGAAR